MTKLDTSGLFLVIHKQLKLKEFQRFSSVTPLLKTCWKLDIKRALLTGCKNLSGTFAFKWHSVSQPAAHKWFYDADDAKWIKIKNVKI